jgi:hypothetical protein
MTLGECSVRDLVVVRWHHPGWFSWLDGTAQHVLVTGRCGDDGVYVRRCDPESLDELDSSWCVLAASTLVIGKVEMHSEGAVCAPQKGKRR